MKQYYCPPFKVGDKIVCIGDDSLNYKKRGMIGRITAFSPSRTSGEWFINWDSSSCGSSWYNFVPFEQWPEHFDNEPVMVED